MASIRRILSEDGEGTNEAKRAAGAVETPDPDADVLALDPSMLVSEPAPVPQVAQEPPSAPGPLPATPAPEISPESEAVLSEPLPEPIAPPAAESLPQSRPDRLVAPAAAAAATSSVGSLLKTLGSHRQSLSVSRAGPTLEDMVREELRPVLKAWLDEHLPGLVERLVRAEIERVVGRAADL